MFPDLLIYLGLEWVHISPKKCQAFNNSSSKSAQKASKAKRRRLWVLREHAEGEQSHSEAQSTSQPGLRPRLCVRLVASKG